SWRALLEARGYAVVRHSFEMRIALGAEPPQVPSPPDGIALRTAVGVEDSATHAVAEESFAGTWGYTPGSVEVFSHSLGPDRELWFLACDGDEIAGVALCRDERSGYPGVAWVDILGVRRPWRRRGIARVLLLHAFDVLHARGRRHVGLNV